MADKLNLPESDAVNEPRVAATCSGVVLAEELVSLIGRREPSSVSVLLARLALLRAVLEATPDYLPAEMLYLRNRLASIRRSVECEDWGVALYEVREMARKLRRWEGGDKGGRPRSRA
jgi:hypothetical protein